MKKLCHKIKGLDIVELYATNSYYTNKVILYVKSGLDGGVKDFHPNSDRISVIINGSLLMQFLQDTADFKIKKARRWWHVKEIIPREKSKRNGGKKCNPTPTLE